MATTRSTGTTRNQLKAENERLQAENERLRRQAAQADRGSLHFSVRLLRQVGIVLLAALAVALLIAGNLLFWTGNTVVKNDRFDEATAPIIRNTAVQKATASYTTQRLFENVDVTSFVQEALPPRAQFLAPTIAGQLRGYTQKTLGAVLARPQFQDRWNKALSKAHAKFIATVKQSGGNGTIDLNDLYQQLSQSLKGTKLSFLAGKQLPSKVGDIQVASGGWIQTLHNVIVHIDTWRVLAVLLFLLCGGLAIYLARRRRRMVQLLAIYCAAGLLATLLALRITREVVAGKVMQQYSDAVRQAVQIVFHPLVVQTATFLILFLFVATVAWLTGHSRSARYLQSRIQLLLAGKLHQAIFGVHENAVTRWVGRYKHYLEWLAVAVVVVLMLVTRLTPKALVLYAILTLLLVLIIELIGAPAQKRLTA